MEPISRREAKLLRQLASTAYDRELGRELEHLETLFAEWRADRLSPQALSAAIHTFHNGVARDLWVLYNRIDPSSTVPRAVAAGLLDESEIPAPLLPKLQNALEFYRRQSGDQDSHAPTV